MFHHGEVFDNTVCFACLMTLWWSVKAVFSLWWMGFQVFFNHFACLKHRAKKLYYHPLRLSVPCFSEHVKIFLQRNRSTSRNKGLTSFCSMFVSSYCFVMCLMLITYLFDQEILIFWSINCLINFLFDLSIWICWSRNCLINILFDQAI